MISSRKLYICPLLAVAFLYACQDSLFQAPSFKEVKRPRTASTGEHQAVAEIGTAAPSFVAEARNRIESSLSISQSIKPASALNVRDFGALGDGAVDDTAAINTALARVPSGGGAVYFPAGTYKISRSLEVPANTFLHGDGFASCIMQSSGEQNCFTVKTENVVVDGIRFVGTGALGGTDFSKNNGIYSDGARNIKIKNCYFERFDGCGVQLRNCFDASVSDNIFYGNVWGAFSTSSDILLYSNIRGGRTIISNNFCHSNNSQGIFVSALGKDSDISINGNMCSTLNEEGEAIQLSDLKRRHGIIVSYNGGNQSGVIVSANTIRNTAWSGIYANSSESETGPFNISNNRISNVGLNGTSLTGGVLLVGGGQGDIIARNIIENVASQGGITVTYDKTPNASCVVSNNTLRSCERGIYLSANASNMVIEGNSILDSVAESIYLANSSRSIIGGNVLVSDNQIVHGSSAKCLFFDTQDSVAPINLKNNILRGTGVGTAMYSRSRYILFKGNVISGFKSGVYVEQALTGRLVDYPQIDANTISKVGTGIVLRANTANSVVPVENNVFVDVDNRLGGDGLYSAGYIATRRGTRIAAEGTGIPTAGTWEVGDLVENRAPTSGGVFGWICVSAGSPGTWKSFGTVSP